jgi:hypothetical protein
LRTLGLVDDLRNIGGRQVLKHAEREDDIKAPVAEREMPSVGNDVARLDTELSRDAPGRPHRAEGGVDADRPIASPRGCDRPAAPVRAEL